MIKERLPKVGIGLNFHKMSHVKILFLVSLLFVAVINPYLVLKYLILIILMLLCTYMCVCIKWTV